MNKKRSIIIFVLLIVVLIVGIILVGGTQEKTESIKEIMRDAVLHENDRINVFGIFNANPGLVAAFAVTAITLVFSLIVRIFVIPKFKNKPKGFQLVLEMCVGYFDKLSKSNSPHRNKFLGAYVFAAGYYIFVSTMLENGTLEITEIEGTEYYRLTEKGRAGVEVFKKQVEKSLRDKVYAAGLRLFARLKSDMDICFEIEPMGSGFSVGCKYRDGDTTLMDINLYAPDEDQANFIRSKIKMNPTDFYCRVIDYIIENEEYVPSVAEGDEGGAEEQYMLW